MKYRFAYVVYQISGYNRMGGTKATAEELERMFSVMEQNGLLRPTRVLTGRPHPITSNRP